MRARLALIALVVLTSGVLMGQIFSNDTFPSGTTTATIAPTLDTFISVSAPTTAQNSATRLSIQGGTTKRALMKFGDLSDIPSGSAILAVHLRVVTEKTGIIINRLRAHRMAIDWDGNATYNTRDGSSAWTAAGAASWTAAWGSSGAYANADSIYDPSGDVVAGQQGPFGVNYYMTAGINNHEHFMDITRMVRNWYSGEWANYGLMLVYDDTTSTGTTQIASLEGTSGAAPYIKVWYLPPGASGTKRIGNGNTGVQ